MIVRRIGQVLQLITQPDHAHLAGLIMERCIALATHPRRQSIIHAVAQHDNGWTEEDANPAIDPESGSILDFVNAPLSVRHAVWPRGVARLRRDPWAAALVAQHAITVYDRFRPQPEWISFFKNMESLRDDLVPAPRLADLLADYAFVRLGDLISLTFCTGWTDKQQFSQWTVQLSGMLVIVTPDPFGGLKFPFEIAAREIPSRRFGTDRDLLMSVSTARVITLEGGVAGRSS